MRHYTLSMLSAILLMSSSSVFSLELTSVVKDSSKAAFTKCDWNSGGNKLNGKPSKNDTVLIHSSVKEPFVLDSDLTVGSLGLLTGENVVAENVKIDIAKGDLLMNVDNHPNKVNSLTLKNSTATIRGKINFNVSTYGNEMGSCKVILDNSSVELKNGIMFMIPNLNIVPQKNLSGVEFQLIGDSKITTKGVILLDSFLAEKPDLHFRFTFVENNGKIPIITIKEAEIEGAEIRVLINGKLKRGKYALLNVTGSKKNDGKLKGIYINDKPVKLGKIENISGNKLSILKGAFDGGAKNDYILEVK